MGKYAGMDGRAITRAAVLDVSRLGAEMILTSEVDYLPAEHRTRIHHERVASIRATRSEAIAAMNAWSEAALADATRRLTTSRVGSAAEESRRVANELRIGRLVGNARATGTPVNVAKDYAERAARAYFAGEADEAEVLGQAAVELGVHDADEVLANVRTDRDLADPVRAKAMRDAADVNVVMSAFDRDIHGAISAAFQDAAALAKSLGDAPSAQAALVEASAAGRRAKLVQALATREHGGTYTEPMGVVSGIPRNEDPRGVAAPDGARLPEPVR